MAKMFYSKEEVLEKLGITVEQLDKLVQNGQLREFRDGVKQMYKVEDVDNFSPIELDISPPDELMVDESGEIPLTDDSADLLGISDTGSSIGLAPMDSGSQIGLMPTDTGDHIGLDDSTEGNAKDDTVITAHGDDALEGEEEEPDSGFPITADQLDKTQLTSDLEDQVSLDAGSSGSGSGLLDLSREADDTSLGAELLEEIYPSTDEGAIETQLPAQMEAAPVPEAAEDVEPQAPLLEQVKAIQYYDPTSGVFGAMMIVPFLVLVYLCCVATAALVGVQPAILTALKGMMTWYVLGGAAALALIILLIGNFMTGSTGQPKTAKTAKPKRLKPKAEKKKKEKKKKGRK